MLAYDLGEMKGSDGSSLRYEIFRRTSEHAISILSKIEQMPFYKELSEKISSPRVSLYFHFVIRDEIFPFIRQACVIQWFKSNGRMMPAKEGAVMVPMSGIFVLLKKCWGFEDVPINLVNPLRFYLTHLAYLRSTIGRFVKRSIEDIDTLRAALFNNGSFLTANQQGGTIACHVAEGLNYSKRNDLSWYPQSGIFPDKVVIYFDKYKYDAEKPIGRDIIKKLESSGFRWVALTKGIIESNRSRYWSPRFFPRNELSEGSRRFPTPHPDAPDHIHFAQCRLREGEEAEGSHAILATERWIAKTWNYMLKQVYYWRSFYNDFNVKINYIPEEGFAKNIAQAIAFEVDNKMHGLLIGRQRSEVYFPYKYYMGHHPKHVFFIWNKRVMSYFDSKYNPIENLVVTGYPNDIFKKRRIFNDINFHKALKSKGIKLIIALFDGVHGRDSFMSTNEMARFYQVFLKVTLSDPGIGLIIKSKKPAVISSLFSIKPLLEEAIRTGRCIKLDDEENRLPSDASSGADLAIGCGISTAVIEAVIGGCKGIHYDMTRLKSHEFYKWGYERIIFDDLERMMAAVKRYREDPVSEPGLGDWSQYLDQLDPFRDGRGGERMGTYMRWLLEAFDSGKDRNRAILYANERYAQQWGEDKIINKRNKNAAT